LRKNLQSVDINLSAKQLTTSYALKTPTQKMEKLIKLVGMLLQTKEYLSWKKGEVDSTKHQNDR